MVKCIYANIPGNPEWEGTFYERLVEHAEWNASAFWQLHFSLIEVAKMGVESSQVDKTLAWAVLKIYSRVTSLIASHFDQNDVFAISNLSYEQIHQYKERLDMAVTGVFSGEVAPESAFDLQNPLIENS
jgi:hypothetical protein